ncbi:MAG: hypothetical protein FWD97_10570 [Defluviitaleaceae bacterium]|nr:hypothetical protein [Defluviitaleaceae bacterium]
MEHFLLLNNKETFPGSGVMSRRAFIAVSTKGFFCPFFGEKCFDCLSPHKISA